MRDVGIWSILGYAYSSTGITVTSRRSWPAFNVVYDALLLLSFDAALDLVLVAAEFVDVLMPE